MPLEQRWVMVCSVCHGDHEYEPVNSPDEAVMNALETNWKHKNGIWKCNTCWVTEEKYEGREI